MIQHQFNPSILREYDIRGTFNDNLTIKDAYALGQRFGFFVKSENGQSICVGRDGRLSSPDLTSALIEGIRSQGMDVFDIGIGPTPMLYYSIKYFEADAGIMVTGSHNPAQDNGFKMALKERPFFGQDIQKLGKTIPACTSIIGTLSTHAEVKEKYCERLLQDYQKNGRRLKIVWDPGNGASSEIVEMLASSDLFCADHILLNATIDGTFPAHHPDPTEPENLKQIIQTVIEQKADLGIAFDGDGDRIGVVDSKGRILWGDQLMVLFAKDVLKDNPKATIIADVKASQVLFEQIELMGGIGLMAKTGHSLIKSKMKETGALLAGEMSGHIFFADRYYGYDDALYAAIRLINILQQSPLSLADIFDQMPKLVNTPEIRIPCADSLKFSIIDKIHAQLKNRNATFSDVDGVRVTTDDGWWLLRASNTQSILVARCESKTEAGLQRLKEQLQEYLGTLLPTGNSKIIKI